MNSRDSQPAASNDTTKRLIKGFLFNTGVTIATHPLSTIKSRMQTRTGPVNTLENIKKAIFLETAHQDATSKIKSLFRGSVASLFEKGLSRTMKYTGQSIVADKLENMAGTHSSTFLQAFSGGLVSTVETALLYPIGNFITRQQLLVDKQSALTLVKNEGLRLFYNGYLAGIADSFPTAFAAFGGYQMMMHYFGVKNNADASVWQMLAGSTVGATLSTFINNPFQVVENRAAQQPHAVKTLPLVKQIYATEGVRGFFLGLGTTLAMSVPKKALTFLFFAPMVYGRSKNQNEEQAAHLKQ